MIVDEDFSIKIAECNTYDSLVIEIYQGIALRILDEECPSMTITLGKNAKVNFIYENEQYTFTNKEALNLFIGQNYKLFYSSDQTENPFKSILHF